MKAIDLYSGIGGWTLGLKFANVDVINSYEWWKDSINTHNINFNLNHPGIDIRGLVDEHRVTKPELLPDPKEINIVVGSPPCTQFSFANRGGSGNIEDGLVDIRAFLQIIEYLKPNTWAMENVPRVAQILMKEVFNPSGRLRRFAHLFNNDPSTIQVYDSSLYGVPQRRKRMIAGNFNHDMLRNYANDIQQRTLGQVISALKVDPVIDPIYKIELNQEQLFDHIEEQSLNLEEERINRESKNFHPVYNKMNFPENLDTPSRTVTALCTRVSRESIIIKNSVGYRRLTIRERASLQSFPITYQFYASTHGNKVKMIGNAIPPLLSYYIVSAMKNVNNPSPPKLIEDPHPMPLVISQDTPPPINGIHYRKNRRFIASIPNLRFGSGVRFDLSNKIENNGDVVWKVSFYYGTSKNIIEHNLNPDALLDYIDITNINISQILDSFKNEIVDIDFDKIQQTWIHKNDTGFHPYDVVDKIGQYVKLLNDHIKVENANFANLLQHIIDKPSVKILNNSSLIVSGILLGSIFNNIALGEKIPVY